MFLSRFTHKARFSHLLLLFSAGLLLSLVPPVESHDSGAHGFVRSSWIEDPSVGTVPSSDLVAAFQKSSWIWTTESTPSNAPQGSVAFRNTFTAPTGKLPTHANVLITADDQFSLFVDGDFVGQSPLSAEIWKNAQFFMVTLNSSASHLFAILATNINGPAGLLAAIQIQFSDGTSSIFTTDSTWIYTTSVAAGWNTLGGSTSGWSTAHILDVYGVGSWGTRVIIPTSVSSFDFTFDFSLWIWSAESNPPNAPPGQRAFRKTFTAPTGKTLRSAFIIPITVDNGFTFYVNGQHIGDSPNKNNASDWESGQQFTVPLSGTTAIFAIIATNLPDMDNVGGDTAAGLLAMIRATFTDGPARPLSRIPVGRFPIPSLWGSKHYLSMIRAGMLPIHKALSV
ncbi:hypothetical protein D9619_003786 [Psilocybe cf. subviscida]|uniref:Glycoside hydrolase family 78 protein n=1 Tax=Psilocybe cf. subviscida TaxID=2480587 RepID=A0A8H5EU13_9AGAR|nr:hypothetical protein D9619_003786 [Psilocybe cf. subviscida]